MKSIVVYSSKSGNTKKLAEAIHSVMPEGTDLVAIDDLENIEPYDNVALGFYVEAGKVDKKSRELLEKIRGKKVGLFATTGLLFLGGKTMTEARDKIEEKNELACAYICPGRIAPAVEAMFLKAFPDQKFLIEDARKPEDYPMPELAHLEEAKKMFKEKFNS